VRLPTPSADALTVLLLVGAAIAACGPVSSPSVAPVGSMPPSPVDGVVVHIDSAGLADVKGFDLRLTDGTILGFTLGPLENGAQFAPGHLSEHQATAIPVRVFYRVVNGIPVVYRLEDAPP
jgi:hypothetical protein